jgi:predicted DNA-binding transcriptional regulator YafY
MSQTERVFHIDRAIGEFGGVKVADIAKKFEVCTRQAKRDIEYMRDRLGAPIVWSAPRRRYEYSEVWNSLRSADEKSLFAFAFLKAILAEYAYVPILSDELIAILEERIAGRYSRIADRVRYELPDLERIENDVAFALCQALLDNSAIDIDYSDAKGERSARSIVPLRLVNYAGKWYCVALDSRSSELRTFAVSRIGKASSAEHAKGAAPVPPSDEEIDHFLSSSYGIFKGEPIGRATLRFYGGAARAVREQVWHRDQTLTDVIAGDGRSSLDLSLPVHDWTELMGRALRCGSNCEVVAPEEFRARWREEIGRMGKLAGSQLFPGNSVLSAQDHSLVVH